MALPIEQRRAVVLAAMYGRSATEIARIEEIPLGTAKGRIRLGMAKLRDVLEIGAE
jgi:RNA polymerase sigma-70 factor (ECF subfamily)